MSFQDIDQEYGGHRSIRDRPMMSLSLSASEAEHTKQCVAIANSIAKINYNVDVISKMCNILGTRKDTQEHRDRLDRVREETRLLARNTTEMIKKLGNDRNLPKERRIQQEKICKDMKASLRAFQDVSNTAAEAERTAVSTARRHMADMPDEQMYSHPDDEDDVHRGLLESEPRPAPSRAQLQIQTHAPTKGMNMSAEEALLRERELEIRKIESTMLEVNEIFKDLAMIVQEQQADIDNIEMNINHTSQHTESATQELTRAAEYQKRARKRACCLMLTVLFIVLFLVLVIYWSS
eukprot:TRINITY_DN821_c0_g1::TRINITY_DN821_c0_g1_i1::g.25472::m.25472 TRINITY_DN821_c0_g1::TRINITY_DN821_c0_g1_i1::g.25472  ORF type:complete len:294 (-),score=47.09,sp/O70439/STX7_MOUSE/31.27/4e-29,Syntaxin_2/PF14523.1/2.8e-19,Syntaxin_2/PF14523.1/2.1e+02,SNARE/PF05739.14/1.1e+04,SNARE/PF05739.14/2.4e+03,SNARE/PF05739.14/5.5e-15,Syntaxin/PF00804.20/0.00068,Syntaxin/PF00804.20/1.2e+02,Herpes_US9/PF06072.6/0.0053,DUF912/PF06024.7/0.02,MCPsignal/PF00015.16/1.6e+02,MCPsignal/PF00015.16/2e+02,MCPsignal/PF00